MAVCLDDLSCLQLAQQVVGHLQQMEVGTQVFSIAHATYKYAIVYMGLSGLQRAMAEAHGVWVQSGSQIIAGFQSSYANVGTVTS